MKYLSVGYTYRKEGHTKIVEYDLSAKQKASLTSKRPDVLLAEKGGHFMTVQQTRLSVDSDVEMDGSQAAESDEDEEEEEEEENTEVIDLGKSMFDTDAREGQLPRAVSGRVKTARGRNERVVAPEECRAHLRRLFCNEAVICSLIFGRHGPFAPLSFGDLSLVSADIFFMDVVPVSPTRFRPPAKIGETLFEHPQNELLARVLTTSYSMRDINVELRVLQEKDIPVDEGQRKQLLASLLERLVQLQVDVNSFIDSSKNPQPVRQGKLPPAGVKQGLEKKEGLFRKHMMVCAIAT
jgi:DNA-directed RNA polymerase I subunit RPA1